MIKEAAKRLPKVKTTLLALTLLTIVATEIIMTCLIPEWREYFYNVLQNKDQANFISSIIYFFMLMLGLGAAQGLKTWVGQLLSFEFRYAATKVLFKTWVKGKRVAKNYTQSMTEALRNATELYLEIAVEVFISAAIVISLIAVNIHNTAIIIAAIIYTIVASALAAFFNKPLIHSDMSWQSSEGALRETISDIANGNEDFSYKKKLETLTFHYYLYIRVLMFFTLFSRLKASLASLIPYILLAGTYFAGGMTLGDFMAGVTIFELIVINSTILLALYPKLTKARASYKLSQTFYEEVRGN